MVRQAEARYMGKVASLGCILCRMECEASGMEFIPYPPETAIHHIRHGQGMSQRAANYLVVGLCEPHHTGPHGIHGDRLALKNLKIDEMDLLAEVIKLLQEQT